MYARSCSSHIRKISNWFAKNLFDVSPRHLVWECVRIGEKSVRAFFVENFSDYRVSLQITANVSGFKIREKYDIHEFSTLRMVLFAGEKREIDAIFFPTAVATIQGKFEVTYFTSERESSPPPKRIHVYGYAGVTVLEMHHAHLLKYPTSESMTFDLGVVSANTSLLTKGIFFRNSGDRAGFVYARFEEDVLPFPVAVDFEPKKFMVKPGEEIPMCITYAATDNDFKFFAEDGHKTFLLGAIKLYMGADILRQHLANIAKHSGCPKIPKLLQELTEKFSSDTGFAVDSSIEGFEKDVHVMDQLLEDVVQKEILVTVKFDS